MAGDDLSESIASLRDLVATPGTFASAYPDTTKDDLLRVLEDAFAECQLEKMLRRHSVEDGYVTPSLTQGEVALVLIFAAVRFMRASLLNANASVTYKAGSAEYSTTTSATLLKAILDDLKAQKDRLIDLAEQGDGPDAGNAAFYMADQYLARVCADWNPMPVSCGW